MMRNNLAWLTALGLLTVACSDDVPTNPTTTLDTTTDTTGDTVDPTMTTVTITTTVGDTDTDGATDSATDTMVDTTMGLDSSTGGESSTGGSSSGGATCGDDMAEGDEACDGTDLLGEDCVSQGFDAGELACAADCSDFDPSACVMFSCGNDLIEGMETCDGTDLAGEDCLTQGFDAGTLACDAGCMAYDISGCVMFSCGNDLVEGMETCDGTDLAGEDCLTQGFDAGTLACDAGCMAYDTSGCITFMCGNDLVEGAEVCDGADVGGETCVTQGFAGGVLGCALDCSAYDTVGCTCAAEEDIGSNTGPAVTTGSTVAEDDTLPISCAAGGGADHVISFTAPAAGDYTFDTFGSDYDTALGLFSSCAAGAELACNDDAAGGGLQSELIMNLAAGQTVFIVVDGFSGDVGNWILNITPPGPPPPDLSCNEEDVGGALGAPVTSGSTVGEDDTLGQSCALGMGGLDHVVLFTAPFAADFTFDTFGSGYDTALAVFSDCAGPELACNDDAAGGGVQSELTLPLLAGESVLLAVGGFNGATGDWMLNIAAPVPPAPVCTEEDLLFSVGAGVAMGTTVGEDEDLAQSCAGGGSVDRVLRFIAPATTTFVFDTFGSGYDTALSLHDDCGLADFACNDDEPGGTLQSELSVDLVAGQQVLIAVSGFNGATGDWILNITQL